ncbi:hypothetical protein EJB05_01233, partial [Eragrostis curvula]
MNNTLEPHRLVPDVFISTTLSTTWCPNNAGTPLEPGTRVPDAFISTTLSTRWRPNPSTRILPPGRQMETYRYEIYAPGGIWVRMTLGNRYQHPDQDEVSFVRGIAPQYIRSAQRYIGTRPANNPRCVRWCRSDRTIRLNLLFSPQSHPQRLLRIHRPIFDYRDENGTRPPLTITIWRGPLQQSGREKRDADAASHSIID